MESRASSPAATFYLKKSEYPAKLPERKGRKPAIESVMNHRILIFSILLVLLLTPGPVLAQTKSVPWLSSIGAGSGSSEIRSVRTEADVTVSDGKKYKTQSLSIISAPPFE